LSKDKRQVICELPLLIEASRGFPPGYCSGARLTNEKGTAYYRVTRVDENRIEVDRGVDSAVFTDADGDGRSLVKIYDFGPGDELTVYQSVFRRYGVD